MNATEHNALVTRAADAIRAATKAKLLSGTAQPRLTVTEAAQAVVTAIHGPPCEYFRFDDEAKSLVEFKPRDEKAA